jgi:hypothetical protein
VKRSSRNTSAAVMNDNKAVDPVPAAAASESEFTAIKQRYHSDITAILQRMRSDCGAIAQRFRSDNEAITK